MSVLASAILLVAVGCLLTADFSAGDFVYLEDCNELCASEPTATCQLKCLRIENGEGEDCINTFVVNNETVFCNE